MGHLAGTPLLHSWSIRARGRVQGVNYRRFAQWRAGELGVRGWVRNEPDGSVSGLLQHSDEAVLEALCAALREGPPAAVVTALEVERLPAQPECGGFDILR